MDQLPVIRNNGSMQWRVSILTRFIYVTPLLHQVLREVQLPVQTAIVKSRVSFL